MEESLKTEREWTVDGCNVWLPERNAFVCTNEKYAKFAANAHNAALTAERECYDVNLAVWEKDNADLRQQLTAERQRREQAERSAGAWEQDAKRYATNADDYKQQLISLVDALKELRTWTDAHDHERVIIDDALANIK